MKDFSRGFLKDIALLLVVTIIFGACFSAAVAYGIDTYFGDTLSALVGEYGQYQLLVHVQQEAKEAFEVQLQELLNKEFPEAKLKEGIAIAGTANFFIALPEEAVTKKVFSSLGRIFSDLPGQSGYTVLLEPTVVVQGVQGNLYGQLISQIERLNHVRFAFRQGGQIYVLLHGPQYSQEVTNQINQILSGYQILEVRFPLGYSVDPAEVGDQLARALSLELNRQVTDVSQSGKGDGQDALVETLTQLKSFLESYATEVDLSLDSPGQVKRGSQIAIGQKQFIIGEHPPAGSLVVEVKSVVDRRATGIIRKGNSEKLVADGRRKLDAYSLQDGTVQARIGEVTLQNNRVLLGKSLSESQKLLTRLASTSKEAELAAKGSLDTIETFKKTQKQVEQVEKILLQLDRLLSSPLGRIRQSDLDELMNTTTGALSQAGKLLAREGNQSESLPQLGQILEEILTLTPQGHPLRQNLEGLTLALEMLGGSKENLASLSPELESWHSNLAGEILKLMRGDRSQQKERVAKLLVSTRKLTGAMEQMDPSPFAPGLQLVLERARAFNEIDLEGISDQADKLGKALPRISDEKLTSSLDLVDQYLAGEVSPADSVSLLVQGKVATGQARKIVKQQLETDKLSLYGMQVGVVKPNMRSEVMRILGEVRLTIAAIFIVIITLLSLVFDHATLICTFRFWLRNQRNKRQAGWRQLAGALPYLYGGAVGGVLLFGMTFLTGARLPILPNSSIIVLGGLIGALMASLAERLSPIATDEVVAGEAMGMDLGEILRQIVIPAARPGLMQLLNTRQVIFGKRGGNQ